MDLEQYLIRYEELTLQLINSVKKEEDLGDLLIKRQEILDILHKFKFSQQDYKYLKLKDRILKLDEELKFEINKSKESLRKRIESLKKAKQARSKYDQSQIRYTFFDKMI